MHTFCASTIGIKVLLFIQTGVNYKRQIKLLRDPAHHGDPQSQEEIFTFRVPLEMTVKVMKMKIKMKPLESQSAQLVTTVKTTS